MRRTIFALLSALNAAVLISPQAMAQDAANCRSAGDWTGLFDFRDAYRPDSEESAKREWAPIAWKPDEKALVLERLAILAEQTPGLLQTAAADGAVSVYRAEFAGYSQAKGGYRRLTISSKAMPVPGYDWLTRIIAHETVHTADPYYKLSSDAEWIALLEPRIEKARSLLAAEGLTVIAAASMPLSDRRTAIEAKIREETGLPSAYSAYNAEESLAEIVSFMVDRNESYTAPADMAAFLRERILCPSSVTSDASGFDYRKGLLETGSGNHQAAVQSFSKAIGHDPQFMLAYMERANAYWAMRINKAAIDDFSKAIDFSSKYSRMRPYIFSSRGLLRMTGGDVSGAAADCAATLEIADNYYNGLLLCGQVKLAQSDFAAAQSYFEKAIEVLPSYKEQVAPWLEKARAGNNGGH